MGNGPKAEVPRYIKTELHKKIVEKISLFRSTTRADMVTVFSSPAPN